MTGTKGFATGGYVPNGGFPLVAPDKGYILPKADEETIRGYIKRLNELEKHLVDNPAEDAIERPSHYTSHPSGVEPISITRHETFLRGNILKYVLRAPYKGTELQDLEKARQYLNWEIERVEEAKKSLPEKEN